MKKKSLVLLYLMNRTQDFLTNRVVSGLPLAFSWSPRGVTLYPQDKYRDHINIYFWRLVKVCDSFEIYPELNQSGNIHYHGILKLKDRVKFYKTVLRHFKQSGFVVVKTNINDSWGQYIKKDKEFMQKVIPKLPIPLVETDIRLQSKTKRKVKVHKPELDNGILKYFPHVIAEYDGQSEPKASGSK